MYILVIHSNSKLNMYLESRPTFEGTPAEKPVISATCLLSLSLHRGLHWHFPFHKFTITKELQYEKKESKTSKELQYEKKESKTSKEGTPAG